MGILTESNFLFWSDEEIMFWEPVVAMSLSIFLTITLFLTIYGLAYLGIKLFLKALKNIKNQIKEIKED